MKKLSLVAAIVILSASSAYAAPSKTYKVTGPVVAMTDTTITVQKNTEKWEIARNSDTKIPSNVKVGDKVKVYYSMTASRVEEAPATSTSSKPATPVAAPAKKK